MLLHLSALIALLRGLSMSSPRCPCPVFCMYLSVEACLSPSLPFAVFALRLVGCDNVCCSSLVLSITAGSGRFAAGNSQSIYVPFGLVNSTKKNKKQGDYFPHHCTRYNITIGQDCRNKLQVHTDAINPHTDIEPTGKHEVYVRKILMRINQTNVEEELACIYTPDGQCRFTITVDRAAILYQQYKRVQELKPKLSKRMKAGSFAKELYALMCRYKDGAIIDNKAQSKVKLADDSSFY